MLQLQPSSLDSRHCRDTPALCFLVPPTVRTLSLSLHVATSGGGDGGGGVVSPAGGSRVGRRDTRTVLVTLTTLSTPTSKLNHQSTRARVGSGNAAQHRVSASPPTASHKPLRQSPTTEASNREWRHSGAAEGPRQGGSWALVTPDGSLFAQNSHSWDYANSCSRYNNTYGHTTQQRQQPACLVPL